MTMRSQWLAAALVLAAPAAAQYAPGGYSPGAYDASGYGEAYDTDGQSVDSVDVFVEPLARYGRWRDSRYGRVWAPNVPRDWRPYTIGHWEEGRFGVTWRSDEPFGWAVFHFGRWAYDAQIGWVWSPDTVWGPGWVAWRDSDDVAGWAPLPPQVSVSFAFGSGFGFNDWGYNQWYQPAWVYVPRGSLYRRSLRDAYLPLSRNRDFWERTRGVTRYERRDGQIVDRSFGRGEPRRDQRLIDRSVYGQRDFGRRDFGGQRDGVPGDGVRGDNGRRDWRGGDVQRGLVPDGRDPRREFGRTVPLTPPLYGSTERQVPPAYGTVPRNDGRLRDDGRPRGFGGRDGVPGGPERQFDRRGDSPAMTPPAMARPSQPAYTRPAQPAFTPPPALTPQPQPSFTPPPAPPTRPDPRPAPSPRDRNTDERPR